MTRRVWFASLAIALSLPLVALACGRGERSGDAAATSGGDFRSPASPGMREQAPGTYRVRFETSAGDVVIEVRRDGAPLGADRFYNLARSGYFDGVRFFRVLPGFVAQFGIHGDPQVSTGWSEQAIRDDPVRRSNARGTVTFATAGPNTRTTQMFINFRDNDRLDGMGFAPIGQVVAGIDVVDRLYAGYGEGAPAGRGPLQDRIQAEGNAYLEREFSELDYVKRATVVAR